MTERLFEKDPYIREFEATVNESVERQGKYYIRLDRTAFFPEGGGQPGDRGFLGEIKVLNTREMDGDIWHQTNGPLEWGTKVLGILDWNHRYANMQNHAGEHIISGLIHQKYGFDNVGFHMGSEAVTLDINGELTKAQVMEIEAEANQAISENVPIETFVPERSALEDIEYRSKKALEGDIRIVKIPGYDCCACCGTHPKRTGEIRLIKILSVQNYKGGVRIFMLAGLRALKDYSDKHENVTEISHLLSAKTGEVCEAVRRLQKENGDLKYQMAGLKRQFLEIKAENLLVHSQGVCVQEENLNGNELREYANLLARRTERVFALSKKTEDTWQFVFIDKKNNARVFLDKLKTVFQGRGGGTDMMIQGTAKGSAEKIQEWFETYIK